MSAVAYAAYLGRHEVLKALFEVIRKKKMKDVAYEDTDNGLQQQEPRDLIIALLEEESRLEYVENYMKSTVEYLPLNLAIALGHTEVAKLILEYGDFSTKNDKAAQGPDYQGLNVGGKKMAWAREYV